MGKGTPLLNCFCTPHSDIWPLRCEELSAGPGSTLFVGNGRPGSPALEAFSFLSRCKESDSRIALGSGRGVAELQMEAVT